MKLSVIIPVFNEENSFSEILEKVVKVNIEKQIIVINDASTDNSKEVIEKEIEKYQNILFLNHEVNKGKGAAIKTAQPKTEGDFVIIQDGDLEYDPNDYYKLLEKAEKLDKTVVYGSRFLNSSSNIPKLSKFANGVLTSITNIFFGVKLTDMETCYKLIHGDLFRSIKLESDRFDFEPEITAKIIKSGYRIVEVPISYNARTKEEGKKIGWADGFQALYKLFKYRF